MHAGCRKDLLRRFGYCQPSRECPPAVQPINDRCVQAMQPSTQPVYQQFTYCGSASGCRYQFTAGRAGVIRACIVCNRLTQELVHGWLFTAGDEIICRSILNLGDLSSFRGSSDKAKGEVLIQFGRAVWCKHPTMSRDSRSQRFQIHQPISGSSDEPGRRGLWLFCQRIVFAADIFPLAGNPAR